MKKINLYALSLMLVFGLTGCGGDNDPTPTKYREVTAVDGYLKNCLMTDSDGNEATYTSEGRYRFGVESTGSLTATGCVNEDTDLALGVTLLAAANSDVISPITTMFVQHPELEEVLKQNLNKTPQELSADYIKSNDLDVAKFSQLLYSVMKADLLGKYADEVKQSATAGAVNTVDDLAVLAVKIINDSNLLDKQAYIDFIDAVKVYDAPVKDIETALQAVKEKMSAEQLPADTTPPAIILNGASAISLVQGTAYSELGATATDDRDATVSVVVTGSVDVNTVNSYTITYTATDSVGNVATLTRVVNVVLPADTTPPVITLNGASTISLVQGSAYSELGATATDDRDTTVSALVTGSVDVNTVNSYTITYTATDSAGNVATLTRVVDVVLPATMHKAMLGPLAGATVEVFTPSDLKNSMTTTVSDSLGGFTLNNTESLDDNEYYLIGVSGGNDLDADDDGNLDNVPTKNEGTIYGLVLGSDIKSGEINITAISDIAWRYIERNLHAMSNNDIERRLNDIATILFASDITGDGKITKKELLSFNPQDENHKNSLNFAYSVLFVKDAENDSIISTYHHNKVEKLRLLLESKFGNKLSFYTAKDTRSEDVKVEVIPFGRGEFFAESGGIDYDVDREKDGNKTFSFYKKSSLLLTITATPKADTEILSWGGCDAVNSDKSQCQVSLNSDHQITVSFGYKDTQVINNLVDLSRANVTLDGDSTIYVTINHDDEELVDKMANLSVDDYVVGGAGEGFLRKVSLITKVSDYKYNLETTDATLEEVIKQGTGVFSKVMTNEDIDPNLSAKQQVFAKAIYSRSVKTNITVSGSPTDPVKRDGVSFSEIEGVELIQSGNPNDTIFTIKIGPPDSSQQNGIYRRSLSEGIGGGVNGTVVLYQKDGVDILKAKGEVKINLKIDIGVSYGLFSGLEYFKLIPEVNAEEKLEIFVGDEIDLGEKVIKLGTIPFQKIVFFIGPVPVYITSQLDVYIGFDGKVTAKVSTGIELKQQIRAGVVYGKNAGVNVIGELNPSWDFLEPKAEVSYEATAFVRPEVSVKLYGVTGPSVPVRGYLKLKTDLVNADTNIDTWKNDQCIGGFDNAAWVGVDSEIKWNIDVGTGDSKLGKFVSEHLRQLERSKQFFKKEWLITRWQVGGICDDSKTPPKLKLTGDHISEITTAFSSQVITKEFIISNSGGTELDWKLGYIEDNVTSVSKKSGKVKPSESETITVTLNPSILDVGKYQNKLEFINNHEFGMVGDDVSGSTERKVSLKLISTIISSPSGFAAELFEPTIVKLTWDYPSTEQHIGLVKGYRVFQSTDQTNWESIVTLNGVNLKSYLVPNLLTDTIYYFKIDAYTDDISSAAVSTSIEVPKIEPEGDCRAHFTGGLMTDHQGSGLSEVYLIDQWSEYVGAGLHPDNNQAFPKAVASTFDGIAIDVGTKVTIYSQKNFEGEVLYEKVGPAIINNIRWKDDSRYAPAVEATWKEPLQTNYPPSVREWSSSDMHDWSYGSLIVECGY